MGTRRGPTSPLLVSRRHVDLCRTGSAGCPAP
ncbi:MULTISPECIES: putative leader peptide [unclassified Pseudonocardia]